MKTLELFTHAGCPARSEGIQLIRGVIKSFQGEVMFREIDLGKNPEKAEARGVRMSPTLVLDGKIISVGLPTSKELKRLLALIVAFLFALLPMNSGAEAASDFSDEAWRQVLDEDTARAKVDYAAIKKSPARLNQFLEEVQAVSRKDYELWNRDQKIAFWVNTYNAAAVKVVIDHYPLKKRLGWKALAYPAESIQQIPDVWDRKVVKVLGRRLGLNEIENEILRKEFSEPRIHFALVCASLGCPILRGEPYEARQLDSQLEDQVRQFLSDPNKFRYEQKSDKIYLSPIFKWFKQDFKPRGGVKAFLKNYLSEEMAGALSPRTKIEWLNYDWSLNDIP